MKNHSIRVLNDKEFDKVVGGADAKFIATATGAGVTCASSVLATGFLIGAMAASRYSHEETLYKLAASFGAIAVAGAISTSAISKISHKQ